jgi:hypothetical protein
MFRLMQALCTEVVSQQYMSSLRFLKCLSLHDCGTLNDEILVALWPEVPNLRSLSIVTQWPEDAPIGITSATLELLCQHCPMLNHLELQFQEGLTAEGVVKVLETCANLLYLDISNSGIEVKDILQLNPVKPVPLNCLYYGSSGEVQEAKERSRIRKYIDAYPQILFCHPNIGLVNDISSASLLSKLSFEHTCNEKEISDGFERGVTVDGLQSDESIASFRAKQQELLSQSSI